jgi:hypothetical protein
MKTSHKIQDAKIMEDIGGNMTTIYASLDNKQLEYQFPIIVVEGKIDNQPIEFFY